MPYSILTNETTPPAAVVGAEPRPRQSGSIIMGWAGGRVMEYSEERGPALPPSHITSHGVISSYDGNFETFDYPVITASSTDGDGGSADFGPLFNPDTSLKNDKWWQTTDWCNGLIMHIYSGTGAGQWVALWDRETNDPNIFRLRDELATAPAEGDKFRIGCLAWLVLPQIAAAPMMGMVQSTRGELAIKLLRGETRGRIEAYVSGRAWEVNDPTYPFKPSTLICADVNRTDLQEQGVLGFAPINSNGDGVTGRELSLAYVDIVDHNDMKIDTIAVEFLSVGAP